MQLHRDPEQTARYPRPSIRRHQPLSLFADTGPANREKVSRSILVGVGKSTWRWKDDHQRPKRRSGLYPKCLHRRQYQPSVVTACTSAGRQACVCIQNDQIAGRRRLTNGQTEYSSQLRPRRIAAIPITSSTALHFRSGAVFPRSSFRWNQASPRSPQQRSPVERVINCGRLRWRRASCEVVYTCDI